VKDVSGFSLKPDCEKKEDYANLGQRIGELGRPDPCQDARSDQNASEDFTDHSRLAKTFKDLRHHFRRRHHDEER
jgi:hypothetical protein